MMLYMCKGVMASVKQHKRLLAGSIFLIAAVFLLIAARCIHGFSQWYALNIYPVLVGFIGRVSGCVPISVVEILLYCLIVTAIGMLLYSFRKKQFYNLFVNMYLIGAVLLFLYSSNCGVNYYRISFAESEGLNVETYSVNELKETCEWLTKEVNYWASLVKRDNDGVMYLSVDKRQEAVNVMKELGETYPEFAGYYPIPKALLNHWILSVQKITGVYSPFTIEANYNAGMVDYNIPLTVCHELSHLKGFMQEEEANFIAFLACIESETADFQYGGYMLAWIHCMNLLYRTNYDAWEEIRQTLTQQVEPDLKANSTFWSRYDGAAAEVADRINDTYLKANGQSDGVESYGRMADLLVVYYQKNILEQ